MWLANVRTQLVSNLEETQRWYKGECWWTSKGTTQLQGWGLGLVSTTTYQNNKTIRKVGSSKVKSICHCETYKCHGFPTQDFKFYDNPSCVSCFFGGTLPHIYHFRNNPWSPSTYWSWWWIRIWNGGHFDFKKIYSHQPKYSVDWHGYDMNECTWKPIRNLSNAMEKVQEFHQQYPSKPKSIVHGTHH